MFVGEAAVRLAWRGARSSPSLIACHPERGVRSPWRPGEESRTPILPNHSRRAHFSTERSEESALVCGWNESRGNSRSLMA